MRFLRTIGKNTKNDKNNFKIKPIIERIVKGQLRWYKNVCKMTTNDKNVGKIEICNNKEVTKRKITSKHIKQPEKRFR